MNEAEINAMVSNLLREEEELNPDRKLNILKKDLHKVFSDLREHGRGIRFSKCKHCKLNYDDILYRFHELIK